MNLGFSHQVNVPDTEDCTIVWQDPNPVSYTHLLYMAQKGVKSITVPNWYDEGREVTIPLDLRFSRCV